MQRTMIPDARLLTAVPYLSHGSRIVDVGTDHAYLPIYLVEEGIVARALACDINLGPIESARANIRASGLSDRIDTMQTDGLAGTEGFAPDHSLIFGMGGELIARILSDAPWVQSERISLVLQPMSRVSLLRRWLLENGFAITGETVSFKEKYYQTIEARFDPTRARGACEWSEEELLLGKLNIEGNAPLLRPLIEHEMQVLEVILRGKARAAQADTTEEVRMLEILKARLETLK